DTGLYVQLTLADDCKLHRLLVGQDKSKIVPSVAIRQDVRGKLMDAKVAKNEWIASLRGIMQNIVRNGINEESVNAISQIFDWVDGFNKRYEVHNSGTKNPQFDDFMKEVANFVKELVATVHTSGDVWPQRVLCATHFISCLFKRWSFVTLTSTSWFSWGDSHFHQALLACRDQFARALERSGGRMDLYLNRLSDQSLRLLMKQLEMLASREEAYARELPYVRLLEMAIAVSGRLRKELPLWESKVGDPENKFFNLDAWMKLSPRSLNMLSIVEHC
ncbi:unnamed protein product, partial [Cladocopium goreaui]